MIELWYSESNQWNLIKYFLGLIFFNKKTHTSRKEILNVYISIIFWVMSSIFSLLYALVFFFKVSPLSNLLFGITTTIPLQSFKYQLIIYV
jgi:hypothetical protein